MTGSVVVGIDVGTTVVKAVAFDDRGAVVSLARRSTGFDIPRPGWAETDMDGLWTEVTRAVGAMAARLDGGAQTIGAVSVSGYMGGAWLVDLDGRPVRPGILWNDGRAVDYLTRWREDGTLREIFRISGNAPNPGFQIPVLCWLLENEPAALDRARTDLFAKDWITYRLTGEMVTDQSDSSHAPGDVHQRGFSEQLMTRCGLESFQSLLPRVAVPGEVVGTITTEAARLTGLKKDTPVVLGLADVTAALTGGGALEAGTACSIVGTSCLNSVITSRPVLEPHGVGLSFLIPGGRWTRTMPNQTGALAFEWFKRELAPAGLSDRELDQAVERVPTGARGLVFHPYLNSTGVLAPVYEPRARARFWGIGVEHTRWDMLRAIYEGVALSMADCLEQLPSFSGAIRLMGGATRSPVWRQMFADATGRPMELVSVSEPGALGVAMQAGVAGGMWGSLEEAAHTCCHIETVVEPDPAVHGEYIRLLRLYQRLRRDLVDEQELRRELWGD